MISAEEINVIKSFVVGGAADFFIAILVFKDLTLIEPKRERLKGFSGDAAFQRDVIIHNGTEGLSKAFDRELLTFR